MASNELLSAIHKSKLPAPLKVTLNAYAYWANSEAGYANLWASLATIARMTGRSRRAVRRDVSDLIHFKLFIEQFEPIPHKWEPGPGRTRRHQIWYERLFTWNADDTAEYRARRRKHQSRKRRDRIAELEQEIAELRVGRTRPTQPDANAPETWDGYDLPPRSGTTYPPSVVPDLQSLDPDLSNDRMVAERGQRPVHAVENSAASGGVSPGRNPRGSEDSFLVMPPSNLRHRQEPSSSTRAESHNTRPVSNSSLGFHVLSEVGRKLLAGYGMGEIPWPEIRSELRRAALRNGLDKPDLIQQVEDSLRVQHDHFLAAGGAPGAPPAHVHQPGKG